MAAAAPVAVPMSKLGGFIIQTGESSPVDWLLEAWAGKSGWSHGAGRNFLRWSGARLELGRVHAVFTRPDRGLATWEERRIALPLSNRCTWLLAFDPAGCRGLD